MPLPFFSVHNRLKQHSVRSQPARIGAVNALNRNIRALEMLIFTPAANRNQKRLTVIAAYQRLLNTYPSLNARRQNNLRRKVMKV